MSRSLLPHGLFLGFEGGIGGIVDSPLSFGIVLSFPKVASLVICTIIRFDFCAFVFIPFDLVVNIQIEYRKKP